ncbi:unnamed protein product [Effrenium voratum]|nr:unnamed protein product [Effrenium voratum]
MVTLDIVKAPFNVGLCPFQVYQNPFSLGGQRSCGLRPEDRARAAREITRCGPDVTENLLADLFRSCGLFEELGQVKYGDGLLVVAHDLALDKKEAEYAVWANPVPADIKDTMKQARTMEEMRRKQLAPEPGLGPPKEARALGFVESLVVAEAEDGTWGHVRFTGPEGYEVTAITCACAALTLLEEEEALAGNGCGVLTPAVAFHGSGFLERLQALGFGGSGGKLRFEVKDGKPSEEEVLGSLRAASERRQGLEQKMRNVKAWDVPAMLR